MNDGMKPAWGGNSIYHTIVFYLERQGTTVPRTTILEYLLNQTNLLDAWKDKDRAMRDAISQGVRNGEFPVICSGPAGYRVTQDPEQIQAAIDYLNSRVESLSIRKAGLKHALGEAKRRESERARGEKVSGHRVQGALFSTGPDQ